MRRILLASLAVIPMVAWAAPVTIGGRVVDAQKAPLAGAYVWAMLQPRGSEEPELLASSRSGGDGRFSLAGVDAPGGDGGAKVAVVAYSEGRALGWELLELPSWANGSVELFCEAPTSLTGRIVDGEERGVAARIEPTHMTGPRTTLGLGSSSRVQLAPEVRKMLAVGTGPDGRFAMGCCPEGGAASLIALADGLGVLEFGGGPGDLGVLEMLQPGTIRVRLTCEAAPGAVAGLQIRATGRGQRVSSPWAARATTDADGVAVLGPMPPEETWVWQEGAPDAEWRMPGTKVELKPGEASALDLALRPTTPVTGRVVDAETGVPIVGAVVGASLRDSRGPLSAPATAGDGTYSFRSLAGLLNVYVLRYPHGYGAPKGNPHDPEVEVGAEPGTVPDIRLHRTETIAGAVVDAHGRPVAGAEVYESPVLAGQGARTGADGSFTLQRVAGVAGAGRRDGLQGLPAGVGAGEAEGLQLFARAGDRVTTQPVEVPPGATGPVRLVVEAGAGVRASLRAVDQIGRPVAGAHVVIHWVVGKYGTQAATGTTGADGRYETPPLWPLGRYVLTLAEPTHRKAQTAAWTPAAGEPHDFGDVVMTGAAGVVRGRVLDVDGKPVANALVCANGEGPGEKRASTDAHGAFRLAGLYDGAAWVTAQTADAIGGARLQTGSEGGTVRLTRWPQEAQLGEPQVATSCSDRDTERRIAAELLKEGMARYGEAGTGYALESYALGSLVCAWAGLDAAKAMELSAEHNGKFESRVRAALAIASIDHAPEQVTAYLDGMPEGYDRVWALADTAQHARRTQPGLSRKLAERALEEARALEDVVSQVAYMSAAAGALYELDPQAAEPVIRETAKLASGMGWEGRDICARGCAAEVLSWVDPSAALALLEFIVGKQEAALYLPTIAARIAAAQPDKAAELLAQIDDGQRDSKLPRVVYAMAPAAPDKAIELARDAERESYRVRALAYVALALRGHSPERARDVLQEAIGAAAASAQVARGQSEAEQLSAVAGELCWVAAQMGYPALDNLVWLALSLRTPDAEGAWRGSEEGLRYLRSLALVRPRLVVDLAEDALARPGALEARPYSAPGHLTLAAAVSDAEVAARVLRATDPEAEGTRTRSDARPWAATVGLLLTKPEDRPVALLATQDDWVPGALYVR